METEDHTKEADARPPLPLYMRRHRAPAFLSYKHVNFFVRDADGQWHCINQFGLWQSCDRPS